MGTVFATLTGMFHVNKL